MNKKTIFSICAAGLILVSGMDAKIVRGRVFSLLRLL